MNYYLKKMNKVRDINKENANILDLFQWNTKTLHRITKNIILQAQKKKLLLQICKLKTKTRTNNNLCKNNKNLYFNKKKI